MRDRYMRIINFFRILEQKIANRRRSNYIFLSTIVLSIFLSNVNKPISAQTVVDEWEMSIYTVKPSSESIFSLWGHTALGISNQQQQIDYIFDFGNFYYDWQMVRDMIQGTAKFYVGITARENFYLTYQLQRRQIFRQRIFLPDLAIQQLYNSLVDLTKIENRDYQYDHFLNNCTTRIRDIVDQSVQGDLKKRWETPYDQKNNFFEAGVENLRGHPLAWYYGRLFLKQFVYEPINPWDKAFLPMALMQQLEEAHLSAPSIPIGKVERLPRLFDEEAPQKSKSNDWQIFLLIFFYLWVIVALVRHNSPRLQFFGQRIWSFAYYFWLVYSCIFSILMLAYLTGHYSLSTVSQASYFWLSYTPINVVILATNLFVVRKSIFSSRLTKRQNKYMIYCSWYHFVAALLAIFSLLLDYSFVQHIYLHAVPTAIIHSLGFFSLQRSTKKLRNKN